jgi:hypothetical protein
MLSLHLVLFGSVVFAEYTSRQSPVHSPALLSLRSMPFAINFLQQITCFGLPLLLSVGFGSMPLVVVALSFVESVLHFLFNSGGHLSLDTDSCVSISALYNLVQSVHGGSPLVQSSSVQCHVPLS